MRIIIMTLVIICLIPLSILGSTINTKATKTWYDSAQIRIDSIRKGNFTFKVVDKNGVAMQDSVKIKHIKHEFPFGVAYDFSSNGSYGNTFTAQGSIICSSDTVVYQTERYGKSLNYLLPVKKGKSYKLVLKFAENYLTASGSRLFDVYINGEKKLEKFDIFKITQAEYKALDTTFYLTAKDSVIKIGFIAISDNAKIDGIALYDSVNKPIILANCGGSVTYTKEGKFVSDSAYIDIHAASSVPSFDDWGTSVLYKYFNYGVTGNPFKWSGIEADSGKLKYDLVDAAVTWAKKVGWDYRGHNLIWGASSATETHQLPLWVHNLLPYPQRAWAACKNRVIRDGGKYGNFFKDYDVLNEPLHANLLQAAVGDSINWYTFMWAHQAAPNVKLYINEYNVEWTGGSVNDYKALIKKMISKGAHIDGIGVQSHLRLFPQSSGFVQNGDSNHDINIPDFKRNMDTLAKLGLPIKFTEFDLDTMSQIKMAYNYARMYRFAFSYPACNGLICWSLTDPGWQPWIGGMFDAQKRPKLVMDTIYNLLHNVWTTKMSGKSQSDGTYKFKGYYGNYEISVKTASGWKIFTIPYAKNNKDSVFILKEDNGLAVKPTFVSATIVTKSQIEMKFDKKMSDPGLSTHNFMIFNDLSTGIDSAKIKKGDSTTIVLSLQNPVKSGYYISLGYANGAQTSTDGGLLENFGPEFVSNPIPNINSAITSTDGKIVTLKFTQPMTDPSGQETHFTIVAGSITHVINTIAKQSGNDSTYLVSLKDTIKFGEKPALSYTIGTIAASNSFTLDAFSKFAVVNKVTKPIFVFTKSLAEFTIYPNPAKNIINIKGSAMIDKVIITDLLGQNVKTVEINSDITSIDVSGLKGSVYVLSIFSGSSVTSKKIVLMTR